MLLKVVSLLGAECMFLFGAEWTNILLSSIRARYKLPLLLKIFCNGSYSFSLTNYLKKCVVWGVWRWLFGVR